MNAVISPYHLTTREPAAMAALLLCERVVTYLPTPASGVSRESIMLAMRRSPRFERMLESWRWSVPLWREGIIDSVESGEDAIEDVRGACERIGTDGSLANVAAFMHERFFDRPATDAGFGATGDQATAPVSPNPGCGLAPQPLDALCADVLKGGPDPGVSVPIAAGLDRLAARKGLISVRSGGTAVRGSGVNPSLAQRAEARLAPPLATLAVPVLVQASAETILRARDEMAAELARMRATLKEAAAENRSAGVRDASRAFGIAFEAFARNVDGRDDRSGRQVKSEYVRLTLARLPGDAALAAAGAAARTIRGTGPRSGPMSTGKPFLALTVESMEMVAETGPAPRRTGAHAASMKV